VIAGLRVYVCVCVYVLKYWMFFGKSFPNLTFSFTCLLTALKGQLKFVSQLVGSQGGLQWTKT